jgi:transcription initiation factor IIE alpha subunit
LAKAREAQRLKEEAASKAGAGNSARDGNDGSGRESSTFVAASDQAAASKGTNGAQPTAVAVAASGDEKKEGEGALFWYIDYRHFVSVVKFRMERMRSRLLQEEERLRLASSDVYCCPNSQSCGRRYTALTAQQRLNTASMKFECAGCGAELQEVRLDELVRSTESLTDKMRRQLFKSPADGVHVSIQGLIEAVDGLVLDTNDPKESIEFANRFGRSYQQLEETGQGSAGLRRGMGGGGRGQYHHCLDCIEIALTGAVGRKIGERLNPTRKSQEYKKERRRQQEKADAVARSLPWFLRTSSVTADRNVGSERNECSKVHVEDATAEYETNGSPKACDSDIFMQSERTKDSATYASTFLLHSR